MSFPVAQRYITGKAKRLMRPMSTQTGAFDDAKWFLAEGLLKGIAVGCQFSLKILSKPRRRPYLHFFSCALFLVGFHKKFLHPLIHTIYIYQVYNLDQQLVMSTKVGASNYSSS